MFSSLLRDRCGSYYETQQGFFYFNQDLEYTLDAQIFDFFQCHDHDLLLSPHLLHMFFLQIKHLIELLKAS